MLITKIKATNFKSFDEVDIDLTKFSTLIGANASGKSNFVGIFQFLSDTFRYGIENAVSMQGGRDYLRNVTINFDKDLSISVFVDCSTDDISSIITKRIIQGTLDDTVDSNIQYTYKVLKFEYHIVLRFIKTRKDFRVLEETFIFNGVLHEYNPRIRTTKPKLISDAILNFYRIESKMRAEANIINEELRLHLFHFIGISSYFTMIRHRFGRKELLIETDFLPIFIPLIRRFFSNISIYHIDPRLPKRSTIITGKNELEADGDNLAIVLKNILENRDNKEKFTTLIKNVLPFVDDLAIERFSYRSLIASLKETYSGKKYFPASLLSDGTINIISLIIILYFENKSLIIIEEPTRAMHPSLIEKFIIMVKDICNDKQIILTTHNPQIIKYIDLHNLFIVRRNKNGYTEILNVDNMKNIKNFLKKDIGIEELYIENLIK